MTAARIFLRCSSLTPVLCRRAASCNTAACFESTWASNQNSGAKACSFGNSSAGLATLNAQNIGTPPSDFAWFPTTDVYGNLLRPSGSLPAGPVAYQTVSTSGSHIANSGYTNFHNAAENAADNAAYRARSGFAFPSPNASSTLQATIFVVGLGGTVGSPPDPILMQRIANDPNGDRFNPAGSLPAAETYTNCSAEATCVNYSSQPQGTFIFSREPFGMG